MKQHGQHHQISDAIGAELGMNREMKRLVKKAQRHKPPRPKGNPDIIIGRTKQNEPLADWQIKALDDSVTLSIAAFTQGKATQYHWGHLVNANNLCQQLEKMGIDSGEPGVLTETEVALRSALNRHNAGKTFAFDGLGLQAVKAMSDIHIAMLQQCTDGAWRKALDDLATATAKAPPDSLLQIAERNNKAMTKYL